MAHIGDDIPDLCIFDNVGVGFAPANAHPVLLQNADFVTTNKGATVPYGRYANYY